MVLCSLSLVSAVAAETSRPVHDPTRLDHVHRDLPVGHPHLAEARRGPHGRQHRRPYVIDRHHHRRPARTGAVRRG
ncbi:hypothetical protein [Streptomyces sp. st115]|uniref:hypothetical protein n=1 Tax=Streptomyces sp. st115 TaxID=1828047 RepID=UPI000BF09B89|nr:hypothetical protein [Streptomyces sp. st115]